jgi:hypothetical protein
VSHSEAILFSKEVYTNKFICPIHILIFTEFFIFTRLTAEKKKEMSKRNVMFLLLTVVSGM